MEDKLTWRDVFDTSKYTAGTQISYVANIARKCYYKYMNFNGIIYKLYSDWKHEKEVISDTGLTVMDLGEFQQLTPIKESELRDEIEKLNNIIIELQMMRRKALVLAQDLVKGIAGLNTVEYFLETFGDKNE